MITLSNHRAIVAIDPDDGGRLAGLVIDGVEILRDPSFNIDNSIFGYGSFPMAPYAGRIRNGRFDFNSHNYQLSNLADPPHAMHGTVIYDVWKVNNQSENSCELSTEISGDWPFKGFVSQEFFLSETEVIIRMKLTAREAMPAWIGFHPWFRKKIAGYDLKISANFSKMYVRDDQKVATNNIIEPKPLPWDDCFIGEEPNIVVSWGDVLSIELSSNYPYWVIYSAPEDALCVEPQSAPPNAIELGKAHMLNPNESIELEFRIHF